MRNNSEDKTIERSYLQRFRFLIREYELVKQKQHPRYRFVSDFYKANNIHKQTFHKYYHRFGKSRDARCLLPEKRGPKWKTRRPLPFIEQKVIEVRQRGNNKYEIHDVLKPRLKQFTPSPSGIYNICKRHQLHILTPKMKEAKRTIIKEKMGELGHIDAHYLPLGIIDGEPKQRYYLVGIIDDCTRLAWAEITTDIKSLTVMFAVLRGINMLKTRYDIRFKELMTNNGPEFGMRTTPQTTKYLHPFERLLIEMEIKHRYTRPRRPQTNGKIERFWRTIEDDLFAEYSFASCEEMHDELSQYLIYYNEHRPHSALDGKTPLAFSQNCQRIS